MIDLSLLPDGGMGWLDASGPKGSIVLSTRIRLARNLEGYVFSQRAKDADRSAVLTRVEEASAATASCCTSATSCPRSSRDWSARRGPDPVRRSWCRGRWG